MIVLSALSLRVSSVELPCTQRHLAHCAYIGYAFGGQAHWIADEELRARPNAVATALEHFHQIVQGLHHVHTCGLIHRYRPHSSQPNSLQQRWLKTATAHTRMTQHQRTLALSSLRKIGIEMRAVPVSHVQTHQHQKLQSSSELLLRVAEI